MTDGQTGKFWENLKHNMPLIKKQNPKNSCKTRITQGKKWSYFYDKAISVGHQVSVHLVVVSCCPKSVIFVCVLLSQPSLHLRAKGSYLNNIAVNF